MDNKELALLKFSNNCNCAQSVLVALASGIESEHTLMKVSSAFGGGIAQQGNTCGAVTGALIALGLKNGYTEVNLEKKASCYEKAQQFIAQFKKQHGSCTCKDLLKYDISIPEEKQKVIEEGLFDTVCPIFVKDAVIIMEGLMQL